MNHFAIALSQAIAIVEAKGIETRPFIDGSYCSPSSKSTLNKLSPIDGRTLPPLHICDGTDVDLTFQASDRAFRGGEWRLRSRIEKKETLFRLAELIEAEIPLLAYLDTLETGRAFANFVEDSIPKAIRALRWFAESIDKIYEHASTPSANELSLITREPLGVIGIITPWNDPLVVSMWKIAPALLMGNSVIVKPAEQSSYSMLRVAALAKQAGIPNGVLNVLPGIGSVAGRAIALHKGIRGVFFTGSTTVGKEIVRCAGESNIKRVGLECGGKSTFIVSARCRDLPAAARTLALNMFYNQGQICSAPSRLILQRSIREAFLDHLRAELPAYVPKDPFASETRVGAVSSREHYERIVAYIQSGLDAGLSMFTAEGFTPPHAHGYYVAPTVFLDVPPDNRLAREEIFGPVLVTHVVDNIDQAIDLANDSVYGLAASVWSNDLDEALLCSRALEAGIVHINSYGDDDNSAPFGGVKESGIGRDKSIFAFDDYSAMKTTWIKLTPPVGKEGP